MPKPDVVNICDQFLETAITQAKPHQPVRKQVRKTNTLIRQPTVHITDTKSFTAALMYTFRVPRYRKSLSRLLFKCLNVDCDSIQQLIQQRNQALDRSEYLENSRLENDQKPEEFYHGHQKRQHDEWHVYHYSEKDK